MPDMSIRAIAKPKRTDNPAVPVLTRYAILSVVYVLLIFLLPGNQSFMHEHRLTSAEYHILQFLVGLPLMAIWFLAFYGYAKLEEYARFIHKSSEAMGFRRLALGCAWIAWSLPIHSIVSLIIRSVINTHPGFSGAGTIIVNYMDMLFAVIGFTFIGMASRQLFDRAKMSLSAASIRGTTLLFLVGGVLYCYLTFRQFTGSGLAATHNNYHLPLWLTVLTIIIPYLYAWFVGMLAVYELIAYGRHVRGVLYRQAMHMLVIGLFTMVMGSIAYQYFRSLQPVHGSLVLGSYLFVTLIFQVVTGIGFLLIALGAGRLKKIEEV